jgi:hypothetical protein
VIVDVVWPSYHAPTSRHGSWDMGLLEDLFDGKLWSPVRGHEYVQRNSFSEVPEETKGAIVVLPGQHHAADIDQFNRDISRFAWVLLFILGDEESLFDVRAVVHPRVNFWIQSRRTVTSDPTNRFLPWGYPQRTKEALKGLRLKTQKLFFSGQATHVRRKQCLMVLTGLSYGLSVQGTPGFTQGFPRPEYLQRMREACIAPCPAGVATPDSFRVWEALEAGCLPVVDAMSPRPDVCPTQHWWNILLGQDPGFPIVGDWQEAYAIIERELRAWPEGGNRAFAWWQKYKRELVYRVRDDVNTLAAGV